MEYEWEETQEDKRVCFSALEVGDVFTITEPPANGIYMKTDDKGYILNIISLSTSIFPTGEMGYLGDDCFCWKLLRHPEAKAGEIA